MNVNVIRTWVCASLLEYCSLRLARSRDTKAVDTYLLATKSTPVYNNTNKNKILRENVSIQLQTPRGSVEFWYPHNLSWPSKEIKNNGLSNEKWPFASFLQFLWKFLACRSIARDPIQPSCYNYEEKRWRGTSMLWSVLSFWFIALYLNSLPGPSNSFLTAAETSASGVS